MHSDEQVNLTVATKIRWSALLAGCLAFGTTFLGGGGSLIESSLLVVAAIVQPRSAKLGRWLMWVTATLLSIQMFLIERPIFGERFKDIAAHPDGMMIVVSSAPLVLLALLVLCDIGLIVDAAKLRHSGQWPLQASQYSLDWVVWIAALVLTAYYGWLNRPPVHLLHGGFGMLAPAITLTCIVLLFDIAVITEIIKRRAHIHS